MAFHSRLTAILLLLSIITVAESSTVNNTVTDWGDALLNQTRSLNTSHQITARLLALTHLAQYKALSANADLGIADDRAVAGSRALHMSQRSTALGKRMSSAVFALARGVHQRIST